MIHQIVEEIIILSNSLFTITLGVCLKTSLIILSKCARRACTASGEPTPTGIGQCCPAIGVSQVDICFGAQKQACTAVWLKSFRPRNIRSDAIAGHFPGVPYRPAGLELKHCRILGKRDLMGLKQIVDLAASSPIFFSSITYTGYRLKQ